MLAAGVAEGAWALAFDAEGLAAEAFLTEGLAEAFLAGVVGLASACFLAGLAGAFFSFEALFFLSASAPLAAALDSLCVRLSPAEAAFLDSSFLLTFAAFLLSFFGSSLGG